VEQVQLMGRLQVEEQVVPVAPLRLQILLAHKLAIKRSQLEQQERVEQQLQTKQAAHHQVVLVVTQEH